MRVQGRHQALVVCVLTFVLIILVAGCGGGNAPSTDNPALNGAQTSNIFVHADTGDIIAVRVGQTVTLDGSTSVTSSAEPLTFAWSFTSKPYASKAELQDTTSVNPSFIADAEGTYMVQLVVSAGGISSQRAIETVEVSISGNLTGKRVHTSYPSQCATCHDGRFAAGDGPIVPVLPKAGDHLATSNMCQACHTTFGFDLFRFADHLEVFGNCSSCHNGVTAIGKSEFHITTTAECNDCHNTVSFLKLDASGNYDHTGLTSGCATCHNGKAAIGVNHITDTPAKSNNDCSFCHSTSTFKNAFPDHSTFKTDGTRCDSCHGVSAQGIKVGHPIVTPAVDCGTCHSVKKFSLGGVFNHRVDASVLRCDVCHTDDNTINAIGTGSFPSHLDPSGTDCGVCHGVGGGSFKNSLIDHSLPSVVSERCDSCHGSTGAASSKKTATHITTQITPTVVDCNACHTPGNFATGTFDHSDVNIGDLACSDCHNDTNTAGKGADHIPTTVECDICHTTIKFIGAVFHPITPVTNNCASCHDGIKSKGKSINHMPTVWDAVQKQDQDCSNCHVVKFDNFTGGVFDHQTGVNNNCATCHDGVVALDKKVNHIPAQTECSQCHNSTIVPGGFMSAALFPNPGVHSNLMNGCEGCHVAKYFPDKLLVKAAGHVPTSQDCHSCHTNVSFADKKFTHADISGNCESCHNGNYFTSANAWGKAQAPNPHPATTLDCGVCHGIGANFKDGIFDHTGIVNNCSLCHGDAAPAPPTGAVTRKSNMISPAHVTTTQDCSVCHIPGTFATAVFNHEKIVNDCGVSCHGGPTPTATIKPPVGFHVDTREDCSVCHNTTAFAGAKYDHTGIVANCASCHDGNIAKGKHGTHVPTGDDCIVCHQTTGFIPGIFDHVGIVDNCQSCHDGILAQGKIVGHVLTSQDCGVCHTPKGFIPATYDHSTVSSSTRCDTCHGVTATGMDAKTNPLHIPTSLDCRSCHTTATFVGGTWTHDGSSTGKCDECHNDTGGGATGKSKDHFSTDLQCDMCHSTDGWAPTSFSHDSQGNYPGDHRRALVCSACHGNIVTTPFVYPSSQYAPFCAACHAGDFSREGDHNGGSSGTVDQNKDCSGGGRGCHKVTDSGF